MMEQPECPRPPPQIVAREFTRQYYTLLNKAPEHLHRFYNSKSLFTYDDSGVVVGQKNIRQAIQLLNFRNCSTNILKLEVQATLSNGVLLHVSGELANEHERMRRFTQIFVLAAEAPKKFYVHNSIFQHEDTFTDTDEDGIFLTDTESDLSAVGDLTTSEYVSDDQSVYVIVPPKPVEPTPSTLYVIMPPIPTQPTPSAEAAMVDIGIMTEVRRSSSEPSCTTKNVVLTQDYYIPQYATRPSSPEQAVPEVQLIECSKPSNQSGVASPSYDIPQYATRPNSPEQAVPQLQLIECSKPSNQSGLVSPSYDIQQYATRPNSPEQAVPQLQLIECSKPSNQSGLVSPSYDIQQYATRPNSPEQAVPQLQLIECSKPSNQSGLVSPQEHKVLQSPKSCLGGEDVLSTASTRSCISGSSTMTRPALEPLMEEVNTFDQKKQQRKNKAKKRQLQQAKREQPKPEQKEQPKREQKEQPQQAKREQPKPEQKEQPKREQKEQPQKAKREQPKPEQKEQPQQAKREPPQLEKKEQPQQAEREQPQLAKKEQPQQENKTQPQLQNKTQPQLQKKEQPQLQKKEQPQLQKKEQPQLQKKEQPQLQKKEQPQLQKKEQPQLQKKEQPQLAKNEQPDQEQKQPAHPENNKQPPQGKLQNPMPVDSSHIALKSYANLLKANLPPITLRTLPLTPPVRIPTSTFTHSNILTPMTTYVTNRMAESASLRLNNNLAPPIQRNVHRLNKGDFEPRRPPNIQYDNRQQLFLGNIPYEATEDDLRKIFGRYGTVLELRIITKAASKLQGLNYGFVTFDSRETAQGCLEQCPIYFPEHGPNSTRLNVREKKPRPPMGNMASNPNRMGGGGCCGSMTRPFAQSMGLGGNSRGGGRSNNQSQSGGYACRR